MAANYHCNYCENSIDDLRVRCKECPDFDLCLKCFSCGAEIGCHRRKHAYQLIDCGTFPIFKNSGWRASEEMALLEAIELYGFGNWGDIGNFIGTKNSDEVKSHFIQYYVNGNIGRIPWGIVKDAEDESGTEAKEEIIDESPLSPSITEPLPDIGLLSTQEQLLLGYMPKRDDFEREFDNEAESLISNLFMNTTEDDELECDLKVAYIDVYKRRLEERFRRKTIVRDYRLVEKFYKAHPIETGNGVTPKLSDETHDDANNCTGGAKSAEKKAHPKSSEEELEEKLKPFIQLQSKLENGRFIQNLVIEKQLKSRIKELMRYRRNGIQQLGEIPLFENVRSKREKKKKSGKTDVTGSAHKAVKRSLEMAFTSHARDDTPGTTTTISSTIGSKILKNPHQNRGSNGPSDYQGKACGSKDSSLGPSGRKGDKDGLPGASEEKLVRGPKCVSPPNSDAKIKHTPVKFDANSLPSSRLLSPNEKKLCNSIRLRPSQYITLKGLILKEYHQKKPKSKSCLESVDRVVCRKVTNFMKQSGWIPA